MVSIEDSHPQPPCSPFNSSSSISSSSKIQRSQGRSMRTIRSTLFQNPKNPTGISENLTDSVMDFRLAELATAVDINKSSHQSCSETLQFLDLSQAFSDFSGCSSDISGELQRLSCLPSAEDLRDEGDESVNQEPWLGFLQKGNFSSEVFDGISPENLQQAVEICLQGLQSPSTDVKRSAAAKLRFLAKNRSENRAVIGESGAVTALISLLRCSDPWTQEHAVTALFNLSLNEENKSVITDSGAIKPLVYVLKTGTEVSKQNAACALLSLALIEDNKISIGVCGAIPPLVSLIIQGSNRGKKDALTTLYKLCTVKQNKERAVSAGAVRPLVDLISAQGSGLFDKAMVVLSSLAGIKEGKSSIVNEGGISVLVDAIEEGSVKGKEFAVLTLLQLCSNSGLGPYSVSIKKAEKDVKVMAKTVDEMSNQFVYTLQVYSCPQFRCFFTYTCMNILMNVFICLFFWSVRACSSWYYLYFLCKKSALFCKAACSPFCTRAATAKAAIAIYVSEVTQTEEVLELSKQIKEKLKEVDRHDFEGETDNRIQTMELVEELRIKRADKQSVLLLDAFNKDRASLPQPLMNPPPLAPLPVYAPPDPHTQQMINEKLKKAEELGERGMVDEA